MNLKHTCLFLLCTAALFSERTKPLILSLQHAERIALKHNKPYLMSDAFQKETREEYLESASALFPKISYSGSYTHTFEPSLAEDVSNGTFTFRKNLLTQKFELKQPIIVTDLFFDYKTRQLQARSSEEFKKNTKNDLIFEVRNRYFYLLYQKNALSIAEENVGYLQEALDVEVGKYELGDAASLEVNQSKLAVTNALSKYYETLKDWKEAKNHLIHVLGINGNYSEDLKLSIDFFPLDSFPLIRNKLHLIATKYDYHSFKFPSLRSLDHQEQSMVTAKKLSIFSDNELQNFIQMAFSNRPDFKMKQLSVSIAEESIRKNKGEYFPKVTSFFDYTKNGGEPSARFFSVDDFSWAAGVKFSWNIFDSLQRERKIRKSKYQKSKAFYDYLYAKQTIETTLRTLLVQMEDAMYAYLSASSGVLVAKQALVQAKEKLSYGKIPPLQYRDAVNQFAQAMNLQNRAAYFLLLSYFSLQKNLGIALDLDSAEH
jgi:outer membrane protein TolC